MTLKDTCIKIVSGPGSSISIPQPTQSFSTQLPLSGSVVLHAAEAEIIGSIDLSEVDSKERPTSIDVKVTSESSVDGLLSSSVYH